MYKNFLHEVAMSWIAAIQNPNRSSSDELQWPERQPTPKGPKLHPRGRLYRDFSKNKLDKTDAGGEGKLHSARQYRVCAAHKKRSETRYTDIFVNSAFFCFTKGLVLRNCRTVCMQLLQYWVQEYHLYSQTVTKNRMRGWTFEVYNMSMNQGNLIKGTFHR